MNFLVCYIVLLLLTMISKFKYKLNIIESLAKNGYKLSDYYGFTRFRPIDFVMGLNLIHALRNMIKSDVSEIDDKEIVRMSDDELFMIHMNDDLLTLLAINMNVNVKNEEDYLKLTKERELDINEENRIVYYNNALGLDKKYVIISVHGDLLENLSNEDQQELIDDYYSYVKKCYQDYIDEFYGGNEEKLDDDILLGKFDTSCFQKEIKKEYAKRILNKLKG